MDPVPAGPDRELMGPQLAGVEEAEQLDAREVRLEQLAVLPASYSRRCQGLSDFSAPGGARVRRLGVEM